MGDTQFIEFRDLDLIESIKLFNSYLKANKKDLQLLESLKNDQEIDLLIKRVNNADNELDLITSAKDLIKTIKKKPEFLDLKVNITRKRRNNYKELCEKISSLHIANDRFSKRVKKSNDLMLIFLFGFSLGICYHLFWYWLISSVEKL